MPTTDERNRTLITPDEFAQMLDELHWTNGKCAGEMEVTEDAVRKWRRGDNELVGPNALLFLRLYRERKPEHGRGNGKGRKSA